MKKILYLNTLLNGKNKISLIISFILLLITYSLFFVMNGFDLYPLFFISLIGVFIFFHSNRVLYQKLLIVFVYYIIVLFLIKINIPYLLGYSDQFEYLEVANYFFNNDINVFNSQYYDNYGVMRIIWTKIIVFLLYIGNGDEKVVLWFNYTLYFIITILVADYFYKNIFKKNYKLYISFIIFVLYSPPFLMINSLYLKESFVGNILVLFGLFLASKKYIKLLIIFPFSLLARKVYFVGSFITYFIIKKFKYKFNFMNFLKIILFVFISMYVFYIFFPQLKIFTHIQDLLDNSQRLSKVLNSTATKSMFIDKQDLLSIKNFIFVPIIGLFDYPVTRIIKVIGIDSFFNSLFISLCWVIFLPFTIITIIKNRKDKFIFFLSAIFITIYLFSSFSMLSPEPEVTRYRYPIYFAMSILSFIGIYNYYTNDFIKSKYKKIIWIWYFVYILSNIVYIII